MSVGVVVFDGGGGKGLSVCVAAHVCDVMCI